MARFGLESLFVLIELSESRPGIIYDLDETTNKIQTCVMKCVVLFGGNCSS